MNKDDEMKYSSEQIQNCISFLESLVKNGGQLINLSEQQRIALMTATGQLSRPNRDEIKKRNKEIKLCNHVRREDSDRANWQRHFRLTGN